MPDPRPSPTAGAGASASHAERAHARFSPSASERWLACPLSIPLTESLVASGAIPDPAADRSGEAAQRGTALHGEAERLLNTGARPDNADPMVVQYVSTVCAIMADHLDMGYQPAELRQMIEARVTLNADVWGSIDFAFLAPGNLYVVDFKTGHGRVPAEHNSQLLTYAAAIIKRERITDENYKIHLWIVQPADVESPVKKWTTSMSRVKEHVRDINRAVRIVHRAVPPYIPPATGEFCQWCPAKSHCPAQRAMATSVFGPVERLVPQSLPAPGEISLNQVAAILQHRKALEEYFDAVVANALQTRRIPPGWKVVAGNTRRGWVDDSAGVIAVLRTYGIPPRELPVTIGEAERRLRQHPALAPTAFADIMRDLTVTQGGGPTIVPESDPRPALPPPGDVFITQA